MCFFLKLWSERSNEKKHNGLTDFVIKSANKQDSVWSYNFHLLEFILFDKQNNVINRSINFYSHFLEFLNATFFFLIQKRSFREKSSTQDPVINVECDIEMRCLIRLVVNIWRLTVVFLKNKYIFLIFCRFLSLFLPPDPQYASQTPFIC